mgnify:FL=1
MTQQPQPQQDDRFPGFIVAPMGDGIGDVSELPEELDFIQKDNVGWRKVADIRDSWQRLMQDVKATLERL